MGVARSIVGAAESALLQHFGVALGGGGGEANSHEGEENGGLEELHVDLFGVRRAKFVDKAFVGLL